MSPSDMFWRHVERGAADACWPWNGARYRAGYGRIRRGRIQRAAHREAYELAVGTVPRDKLVCHRCDNPPCCNPAHLFLGTAADNNGDRHAKGRDGRLPGELHPMAKLRTEDVIAMRAMRDAGYIFKDIAARYGVTAQAAYLAVSGKSWGHL